jgi:DNA-binding NtrC family response regulator
LDSDPDQLLKLAEVFRNQGYTAETAQDLATARELLLKRMPDVAMLRETIDGESSLDVLGKLNLGDVMEIYLLSEERSIESAVRAMRLGVSDYFETPFDEQRLIDNLRKVKEELECEVGEDAAGTGRGGMVGDSVSMQRLMRLIRKCAPSEASVLIIGESGTGKELVMQLIHELSPRRECELVTVNCSAIARELMESELFGHMKGSFTGAASNHRGFFERAAGGTLFLDEITEMDVALQSKLLRALESGHIRRVGAEKDTPVDVRVIAATNLDPLEAVENDLLREDLYYRLAQFPLHVPPLRERGNDLELLCRYFLRQQNDEAGIEKSFSEDVMEAFRLYDWPGNVRELRNAIIHGHLVAGTVIELDDLPEQIREVVRGDRASSTGIGASIADVEREHILATLEHYGGDKKKAAETLGISLKTLYNRLNEYEDG